MKCRKCDSPRVASITAKCSDCCGVTVNGVDHDGYVPGDMGVGRGDYIEFSWCLQCGQLQDGAYPLKQCELEIATAPTNPGIVAVS